MRPASGTIASAEPRKMTAGAACSPAATQVSGTTPRSRFSRLARRKTQSSRAVRCKGASAPVVQERSTSSPRVWSPTSGDSGTQPTGGAQSGGAAGGLHVEDGAEAGEGAAFEARDLHLRDAEAAGD